ncbi:MAG: hypothetical protein KF773_27415 [Deltaproteobacteria bacterium]|nr:hypothetical protein [Deltaproteobacteria bacterium]
MIVDFSLVSWIGRRPNPSDDQLARLDDLLELCDRALDVLSGAKLLQPRSVTLESWRALAPSHGRGSRAPVTIEVKGVALRDLVLREIATHHEGLVPRAIEIHGCGTILSAFGEVDAELDNVIVLRGELGEVQRIWIEATCDAWMPYDLVGTPQLRCYARNAPRLSEALRRVDEALELELYGDSSKHAQVGANFTVDNLRYGDGSVFVPGFPEPFEGDVSTLYIGWPNYVLGPRLRSGAGDEVRTGYMIASPDTPVLITLTQGHRESAEVMQKALALEVPGIARLGWIGEPPAAGIPYADALVEELPPRSSPASMHAPLAEAQVIAIGAAAAEVLERAHAAKLVVGGIFPETVYLDEQLRFAALAPRGPQFIAHSPQRAPGMRSYQVPYEGHEVLALGRLGGAPNDVFALCATLQHLATGRHPFGSIFPEIMQRVLVGAPEPYPGRLGEVLARGLDTAPERRPTAAQLAAALRALA